MIRLPRVRKVHEIQLKSLHTYKNHLNNIGSIVTLMIADAQQQITHLTISGVAEKQTTQLKSNKQKGVDTCFYGVVLYCTGYTTFILRRKCQQS